MVRQSALLPPEHVGQLEQPHPPAGAAGEGDQNHVVLIREAGFSRKSAVTLEFELSAVRTPDAA